MTTAYITHSDCLRHEMGPGHPESPERLVAINEQMRSSGLHDQLLNLDAPLACADDLNRVHRGAYVDLIFENAPAFSASSPLVTSTILLHSTSLPIA